MGLSRCPSLAGVAALLACLVHGGVAQPVPDETPMIDPAVRAAVVGGPARVLVELRLPAPPESGPATGSAREQAIAAARRDVLTRLAGTRHRLIRQYTTIPLLVLEIGLDALRALEGMSDLVVRVRIDQLRRPAGSG